MQECGAEPGDVLEISPRPICLLTGCKDAWRLTNHGYQGMAMPEHVVIRVIPTPEFTDLTSITKASA